MPETQMTQNCKLCQGMRGFHAVLYKNGVYYAAWAVCQVCDGAGRTTPASELPPGRVQVTLPAHGLAKEPRTLRWEFLTIGTVVLDACRKAFENYNRLVDMGRCGPHANHRFILPQGKKNV